MVWARSLAIVAISVSSALATPSHVHAYDAVTGELFIFNLTTCGQYAEDRKLPRDVDAHLLDRLYIKGWLSAYNMLVSGANVRGDATVDDTMLWLERYCFNHPFATLQDGLANFAKQTTPAVQLAPAPNKPRSKP